MKNPSPRRKKIAIIRNAYSFDFGGGERMPVDLAARLTGAGFDPIIISSSRQLLAYADSKNIPAIHGWWWSKQNWSGLRVFLTPVYFIWQLLLFFWYFLTFLRLRPRVVHAQSRDDFIAATLAGRLSGARVIWSDHADLKYVYKNLGVWYKNPIGKAVWFCSKFVHTVILTSRADKAGIESAAGRSLNTKYRVIYNGIVDRPELLGTAPDNRKVVFAATSRLVAAKGIGELINAFIPLAHTRGDVELWLFGGGPEEAKFKKLAKSEKRIIFKGHLPDPLTQLAKADIFVHPSYMEGFSVSLVEAAMLGKPIIACRVGGNPELVTDGVNGLLIPPADETALGAAMAKLADDKKLRVNYGRAGRDLYEKSFVLDKIVEKEYLPFYE